MFRQAKFVFLISILALIPSVALAGSHSLTKYEHNDVDGIGFFDLVVSLNWEPTESEKTGRLQTAFEQFAKDIYKMTEGKHKIRRLYVYTDNEHMNNADIRIMEKGGRSNAHANGIFDSGGRIVAYMSLPDGTQRSGSDIGHAIAHEFGHYIYGLYDEYQGTTENSSFPGTPLSGDTSKATIMCTQGDWQWFSIDADYADETGRSTAQWRVFESSSWRTLVRNPNDDPLNDHFISAFPRVRYKEFDQMASPASLTKPSEGWNTHFEIDYMGGNLAVLLIDQSGSMGEDTPPDLDAAKSAAKQFIDMMETGNRVAVIAFTTSANTVVGITELVDQSTKESVKAAIDTLDFGGKTDFDVALAEAISVFDSSPIPNETRYAIMVTDGHAAEPDLQDYIERAIPVFTIGLDVYSPDYADAEDILINIATETGGTYSISPTSSELSDLYAEINRDVLGRLVLLKKRQQNLSVGEKSEMTATCSRLEKNLAFRAGWKSGDSMSVELETPAGTVITPSSLPPGVSYASEGTYGLYTVETPQEGIWKIIVSADGVSSGGTVSREAMAESTLSAKLQLLGGRYPEPISILASVSAPEPVAGADVVASFTVPAGAEPVSDMVLKDDGIPPDLKAGDGVYSGVLADYSVDGNYKVTIAVTNPSGNAYKDTGNALESGIDAPVEVLPPFERQVEKTITTENYGAQPLHPMDAVVIPLDNTKVWGSIENDGDVLWYKFTAKKGGEYFFQTSNLVSRDSTAMATLMTLYGPDIKTVLETGSQNTGAGTSQITWTAESEGVYYISIGHGSPGTGTYALTAYADESNVAATTPEPSGGGAASGGGGGGTGCFIEAVLPFSM